MLPWGSTTVIGRIVTVLVEAHLDEVLVVTGGTHQQVEQALEGLPIWTVFNPDFEQSEMVDRPPPGAWAGRPTLGCCTGCAGRPAPNPARGGETCAG